MKKLFRAYQCSNFARSRRAFRAWYRLRLGKRLAEVERGVLEEILPNLFGYHLLQVGAPSNADLLSSSRVSHCMVLDELITGDEGHHKRRSLVGEAASLPFSSASLDVIVLPHTLEFCENPHEVLREVDRTLVPEGHVVILGFNPWSLWGITRLLVGWRGRVPWCGRFIGASRIKDWLALLGFDTIVVRPYFHRPPLQHSGVMERLHFMERLGNRWWPIFGGGFVLVARKRVSTLTPIRPRWRPRSRLVPGRLAEPTCRREGQE